MNHWDRLLSALRGEPFDSLPIALWRNWPDCDRDPTALARAVMSWQRRYDFDLVVFSTPHTCIAEHFGAPRAERADAFGCRVLAQHPVFQPEQWLRLQASAAQEDLLPGYNLGLRQVADALGGTAPLLQTVPSPLTAAWHLAGDALFDHMRAAPECVDAGLNALTQATSNFARAAMEAGACGIRMVVDLRASGRFTRDDQVRFGRFSDNRVFDAVRDSAKWQLLELAVGGAWFDAYVDYPVQIIAWPDRAEGPELSAAGKRFSGIVAGGLDAAGVLATGQRAQVDEEVTDVVSRLGGAHVLLTAGGPCAPTAPEGNIDGVIDAVRRRSDRPKEE